MKFFKLILHRMPGFEQQGFTLDELSPGINLVYGPNASGKSTTARAIQGLIWPDIIKPERPRLTGWMEVQGEEWMIDLDVDHVAYQRNGVEAEPPSGLPSPDVRQRYYLALHELIQDENQSFAEQILREAAGGYDARAAMESLGYQDRVVRPASVLRELQDTIKAVKQARQTQQRLREEENQLQQLKEDRDKARDARDRAAWLRKAIAYQEALNTRQEAQERFDSFPRGMAHLVGDEWERLEEIQNELEVQQVKKHAAERAIEEAEEQIEQCRLPEDGVPDTCLPELRTLIERLRELQRERDRLHREINSAMNLEDENRRRIQPEIDPQFLERLDAQALEAFEAFFKEAEIHRAEHLTRLELYNWLGALESPPLLEQTKKGVELLVRWLNAAEGNGSLHYRWFLFGSLLAGGLLAAGGVLLGFDVPILDAQEHMLLLNSGLILAGIALFVWIWTSHPNRKKRKELQAEFEALELDPPPRWTVKEVMQASAHLQSRLREMEVEHEKTLRWSQLEGQIQQSEEQVERLNAKRQELIQRYGLELILPRQARAEAHLLNLIANILNWQKAHDARLAKEAELHTIQNQFEACRADIRHALSPYSDTVVETPEEASAEEVVLNLRRERFMEASASRRAATIRLQDSESALQLLHGDYNALFDRVGLQPGEDAQLHEYCRIHDDYLDAKKSLTEAELFERQAFDALEAHPDLRERELDDLQRELEQQDLMAETLEELNQRIGGIERAIRESKEKDDLEEAMAKEEEARDQLRKEREKNYASLLGALLVSEIEKANRKENLPQVFHHARKIFTQITQGRYRLDLDQQTPSSFRAYDTALERGQSLEELSSGTRLQIMLAVRIAFVERQEGGMALPLLMDEILANSDESRARIIIDSAIELARAGRQIFYFTAQHDEAAKWDAALKNTNLPYKIIDLAVVRDFSEADRLNLANLPEIPRYQHPAPQGCTHEEYGELLGIQWFDLFGPLGGAHIWHFIDSPEILYRLLERGINRWGQLQNLVEQYGSQVVDENPQVYQRAMAVAFVLETLARCWKVGRGRPVDRSALMDSGAVTDAFLNKACQLAEQCNGDAKKLIRRIQEGDITHFRRNQCDRLELYLKENGYLDERPIQSFEEIRTQVLVAFERSQHRGLLSNETVETILARTYAQQTRPTQDANPLCQDTLRQLPPRN